MLRLRDREGIQDLDGIGMDKGRSQTDPYDREEDEMKKGTAEEVLKVIEGLKDEENRRVVISVDHFGWQVDIEDKCHNLRTHETFWKPVASWTSATFIEALDMVVGFDERVKGAE